MTGHVSEAERRGVCVLGSINLDIVCTVAKLPAPGETVTATGVQRLPGGKGGNQAVASASWGAATSIIAAVGRDEAAEAPLAHLKSAGVDISRIRTTHSSPSGQAYIFVSAAGENMIVVVGGANLEVGPKNIDQAGLGQFKVFLSQLETPVAAIEALFSSEAARGGVRILNAAPAAPSGRALFPLADILVVNETELASFAGLAEPPTSQEAIARAARRLISREDQQVVITLGAAGAAAVDARAFAMIPGRPARVIDTTGAGDCFCGVLAASLALGADLPSALNQANLAASCSTESLGAAVSRTLRAEVEALGRAAF